MSTYHDMANRQVGTGSTRPRQLLTLLSDTEEVRAA